MIATTAATAQTMLHTAMRAPVTVVVALTKEQGAVTALRSVTCGKKGHLARVCHSNVLQNTSPTPRAASTVQTHQSQVEEYPLFIIGNMETRPVVVTLRLDDRQIDLVVDTGTAVSIISATTYHTLWSEDQAPELLASSVKLRTYTRVVIEVLGAIEVDVCYMDLQERLRLLVVAGDGPSLFGRDWLRKFRFDWKELNFIHHTPQATPRFCKPLQIPLHGALLATPACNNGVEC